MLTIEDKLKNLILERYGTFTEFCRCIDMPNSTFTSIMQKGVHNANITNIIKICRALDISTDELAHDKIVPKGKKLQSQKSMTDIEDIIKFTKMNISTYSDLTISGIPLKEDDIASLLDAIDLCLEFIKRRVERDN